MTSLQILAAATVAVPMMSALAAALVPAGWVTRAALTGTVATAVLALCLAGRAVADPGHPVIGSWIVIDAGSGLLLAVIAMTGLTSVLLSPGWLRGATGSVVAARHRHRAYYTVLLVFWAILLAVPLAGNLGVAWLLVEATTAVSALLVGFSGRRHALEAGWKYLILTSLGLGVALLGIVILAAGLPGGAGGLTWQHLAAFGSGKPAAVTAYLLLLTGLAAKIGWAPVHNWLPDAHSEAPPPASAMLSAALLPAVLLIAWRSERALAPVIGLHQAQRLLIMFGLASLAVAVPFLWRPMPFKRLLAYSSLEHMGVIALGVGFGTPLALAGVAVHIVGHAIAKALGFHTAAPLLAHEPRAASHPVTGIGRTAPALGTAMGISLGALSGLPPSPLFISEVLILAGGFSSGRSWAAAVAAILLALGFLGLAHAAIETVAGKAHKRSKHGPDGPGLAGLGPVTALAGVSSVLMLLLAAAAPWLTSTGFIAALQRGMP